MNSTSLAQNLSIDSSGNSSYFEYSENEVKMKNFAKDLLKSRIFLGRYIERRLINQQIGYRDIVVISAAETELKKDLLDVQRKLCIVNPGIFIGITETDVIGCSPAGAVCLCTEIDNQPFGAFWFQIKSLKFREKEVIATLKCLRYITESFIELEPILTGKLKPKAVSASIQETSESLSETFSEIKGNLKHALSISNVKDFVTFIFALIIAAFTGSTAFVNFLGNFVLALVREMSILIKNSTPMFLGLLDFFSKIVGGFYILLAMLFRQNAPPPINSRSITSFSRQSSRRSYDYDDKQFD